MNYYIVTEEIFNTLTKENISYMLKSLDDTQRLIATTDTVSERVRKFNNIDTCSSYTLLIILIGLEMELALKRGRLKK